MMFDSDISMQSPFVLLSREGQNHVFHLTGTIEKPRTLNELSGLWNENPVMAGEESVSAFFLLPYCQISERGYTVKYNDDPILLLRPTTGKAIPKKELLAQLPDESARLNVTDTAFDVSDAEYSERVRRVIRDEIENGEGANFVIARSCEGVITDFDLRKALRIFRHLLENEYGAYWIYLFYTGENFIIGATPERHICVYGRDVLMNPISGTFRKTDYEDAVSARQGLLTFLQDQKEIFELFMVVDEELKMMSQICSEGGQILGPFLKEMGRLVHTEYLLAGRTSRCPEEILKYSMFAPTVTGSPIENASNIIAKYEQRSRRYYSGIAGLKGISAKGVPYLDSSIIIRTAEIKPDGQFRLSGGATLVRDSDPVSEMQETRVKISGVLAALSGAAKPPYIIGQLRLDKDVQRLLRQRNHHLATFWFQRQSEKDAAEKDFFSNRRIVIMDNEDTFTEMQAHILRRLGARPKIIRWNEFDLSRLSSDAIPVIGPGPGDPTHIAHPKMAKIHQVVRSLLDAKRPFAAICLGHQVTALELGLQIQRKQNPSQGIQVKINTPLGEEAVGFYNTFAAIRPDQSAPFEIDADSETGEIHAMRASHFSTVQYHPESILSEHGAALFSQMFKTLESPLL